MFDSLFEKHITRKNLIFAFAVIAVTILVMQMQDIAIMFFASYVIACSLNPLVDILTKKYPRNIASIIVLTCTIVILALFFIPLIILVGHETKQLLIMFPSYIDNIQEFINKQQFPMQSDITTPHFDGLISAVTNFTTNLVHQIINFSKNISSGLVYLIASIMITYYFMADKAMIKNAYSCLFPTQMRQKANEVLDIISQKVGGYIVGQVAAMTSVGIIMSIGLIILKVDYAVLLGLIVAILDIIPVAGPTIALIICLLAAYKYGAIVLVSVAIVFAIAQLVENSLVRPYVFGKLLDIHPILIYLFLFITAKYMGIVGVVFAPAIATTVYVLIQELYIKTIKNG